MNARELFVVLTRVAGVALAAMSVPAFGAEFWLAGVAGVLVGAGLAFGANALADLFRWPEEVPSGGDETGAVEGEGRRAVAYGAVLLAVLMSIEPFASLVQRLSHVRGVEVRDVLWDFRWALVEMVLLATVVLLAVRWARRRPGPVA